MAVAAQAAPRAAFTRPFSPIPDSPFPRSAVSPPPKELPLARPSLISSMLLPGDNISTPVSAVAPSPCTSDTGTVFSDLEGEPNMTEEMPPAINTSIKSPIIHEPTSATDADESSVSADSPATTKSPQSTKSGSSLRIDVVKRLVPQQDEDAPQSVIHVPSGFTDFVRPENTASHERGNAVMTAKKGKEGGFSRPASRASQASKVSQASQASTAKLITPISASTKTAGSIATQLNSNQQQAVNNTSTVSSARSDSTVKEQENDTADTDRFYDSQIPPTPLQTSLPPMPGDWTKTPRAQTRYDLAQMHRPGSSLASISEHEDFDTSEAYISGLSGDEAGAFAKARTFFRTADDEIYALKTALSECWTLCNTLASLSYIHRERIFTNHSLKGDMHGQAWKTCWKLCQNLYETGNEHSTVSSRPTLDLCREFCQALFEVRVRNNEAADSVLRVSFELNNHLFNTHDKSLPEAFRERTLDFYITLCHRLMKQSTEMGEEPNSLLKACWSLAEMLFSLRQNKREGKRPDEELLGSAIQACWELSDLFREGWTQIRPERGTPRPSQTTFSQAFQQARRAGYVDDNGNVKLTPETPTTVFEDNVAISPDDAPFPNIMVLNSDNIMPPPSAISTTSAPPALVRPNTTQRMVKPNGRWASVGTVLSNAEDPNSGASSRASSKNRTSNPQQTTRSVPEDPMMVLLKSLFVRAAVQTGRGFSPDSRSASESTNVYTSLAAFVQTLPENAFGSQPWQHNLLENYKKTVHNDTTFRTLSASAVQIGLGVDQRKGKADIAMAVRAMVAGTYGWGWLRDLFRYGYGVYIEEVLSKEEDDDNVQRTPNPQKRHSLPLRKASNRTNGSVNEPRSAQV